MLPPSADKQCRSGFTSLQPVRYAASGQPGSHVPCTLHCTISGIQQLTELFHSHPTPRPWTLVRASRSGCPIVTCLSPSAPPHRQSPPWDGEGCQSKYTESSASVVGTRTSETPCDQVLYSTPAICRRTGRFTSRQTDRGQDSAMQGQRLRGGLTGYCTHLPADNKFPVPPKKAMQ